MYQLLKMVEVANSSNSSQNNSYMIEMLGAPTGQLSLTHIVVLLIEPWGSTLLKKKWIVY